MLGRPRVSTPFPATPLFEPLRPPQPAAGADRRVPRVEGPARAAQQARPAVRAGRAVRALERLRTERQAGAERRSEEHTSELQSRQYLVCRLLLEKKKT